MSRAFLSLGSNLGDRMSYLRTAVRALENGPLITVTGVSVVYETEPVEVEDEQPDYLNCVAGLDYRASALELLRFCQGVESVLGRVRRAGIKAPRTLDLDILLFGEETMKTPELAIPHPGVMRVFNLLGLWDLDPALHIPGYGAVKDLLRSADLGGIRALSEGI